MSDQTSFMSLAVSGYRMSDEIEDFIEEWHAGDGDDEVYEFLGMTWEEYSLWLSDPNTIDLIITARMRRQSIREAVNDNIHRRERLAARTDDAQKIAALRDWIAAQPDR